MMRRLSIWLATIVVVVVLCAGARGAEETAPSSPASPAVARRLTLDDALRAALANNTGVLVAQQQLRSARARVREARSALGPQLTGQITHTRSGPVSSVEFPTPTGSVTVELGTPKTTRETLSLALPIDISGQISAAVSAAQFQRLAAELALASASQSVALATQEAYLGVLRAEGLVSVAQETLTAAKEHQRVAQLSFQAGTVPRYDTLRADVQVAAAQLALTSALNAVDLAKAGLNRVMGANVNQPIEVDPVPQTATAPPPPLEEHQQKAERERPEVLQAQALVRAAEKGVRIAKAGLYPTLAIAASQMHDENPSGFGGNSNSWSATAAFSLPIFDSGQSRARTDQAQASAESARIAQRDTVEQVRLEVRQAHVQIIDAEQRLAVAEKDVVTAREALRLAQLRYQAGIGTAVETADAEAALTQSSTSQVNAFYDYLLAVARFQRATGAPAPEVK